MSRWNCRCVVTFQRGREQGAAAGKGPNLCNLQRDSPTLDPRLVSGRTQPAARPGAFARERAVGKEHFEIVLVPQVLEGLGRVLDGELEHVVTPQQIAVQRVVKCG